MNTKEIEYKRFIFSFDDLYKEAKKQFYAYEKIEGIENWKEYDFSIDCAEDQMKFKDMLEIRFVEELTEASEAYLNKEYDHFWEEITDALNFFLSAYIMAEIDFNELSNPEEYLRLTHYMSSIPSSFEDLSIIFYPVIHSAGNLCNLLKNRPWSQSNYLVSLFDFKQRSEKLWKDFWNLCFNLGLTKEDIFIMFEKKMMVNFWRIKTGY